MANNPYEKYSYNELMKFIGETEEEEMRGSITRDEALNRYMLIDAARVKNGNKNQSEKALKEMKANKANHEKFAEESSLKSTTYRVGGYPQSMVDEEKANAARSKNIASQYDAVIKAAEKNDEKKPLTSSYMSFSYSDLSNNRKRIEEQQMSGDITSEAAQREYDDIDIARAYNGNASELKDFIKQAEASKKNWEEISKANIIPLAPSRMTLEQGKVYMEEAKTKGSTKRKADERVQFYSDLIAIANSNIDKIEKDEAATSANEYYGNIAQERGGSSDYVPSEWVHSDYDNINRFADAGTRGGVWGMLTSEELSTLNSLYNMDRENPVLFQKYFDELKPVLEYRLANKESEEAREFGEAHPYIAGVESVARNVIGAVPAAVDNVVEGIFGGGVNTYDATSRYLRESQAYRQGGSEYMSKNYGWGGNFAYNAGLSMVENIANVGLFGGAGAGAVAFNMASNAAAQQMINIADRGGSDAQIIAGGVLAGVTEYFFEKVSIDKLFEPKMAKTLAGHIKNGLIQSGVEGSEEFFTEIANTFLDAAIMQSNSENEIKRRKYIYEDGMSEEDAAKKVFMETVEQVLESAASGMLSGGVMGTGSSVVQTVSHNNYMAEIGTRFSNNPDKLNAIIEIGVQNGNAEAKTLQRKIKNGESISGKDAGKLLESVFSESIIKNGGMGNIIDSIEILEGDRPSFRNSQELLDTAKAVMNLAQGKTTNADEALISRSSGAMTLLTAIEGNNKAMRSIRESAKVDLRETPHQSAELTASPQSEALEGMRYKYAEDVERGASESGIGIDKPLESYPYNTQTVIKDYVVSTNETLLEKAEKFRADKNAGFERINLSRVSDREAQDIKKITGIDVSGYNHAINSSTLIHIENRHGKNGKHDNTMSNLEDVARVEYVLENYDNVELAKDKKGRIIYSKEFRDLNNNPAPLLIFTKKINGTYYGAVAVAENSHKKLWIGTTYISKNKEGITQELHDEISSLSITPEANLASLPSDKSLSQNNPTVKDGEIYSQGKRVSISEAAKMSDNIVITKESENYRKTNPTGYKLIKTLAKDLGMKVMFVNGLTDGNGQVLYGAITSEGIFVNSNAKNIESFVVTHEFGHRMKDTAPEAWKKYQNYVVEREKVIGRYYDKFNDKAEKYGDNADVINEEIAADYIKELFNNETELVEFIYQNRGLAATVRDVYYGVLDKLGLLDEKKKAQLLWNKAYKKAVQNKEKKFEGIKKSVTERKEQAFRPATETGWLSQQWIAQRSADNEALAQPLEEISKIITKELNIPISNRKFTDEGVAGSYNLTSEAIHTRAKNDIVTVAHEVGHHLDKVLKMQELDGFKKVVENFDRTLAALGYGEGAKKTEAVGEFVRMYLTNKDMAKAFAPEYYEAFENALKEKGLDKTIEKLADAVNAYLSSSVSEKLDLAITGTDGRRKLQKIKEDGIDVKKALEEKKTKFSELWDGLNQNFIDSFYAIEKAQTRLFVDNKEGKQDAHLLATNSLNSAARSAYILTKSFTNIDGEEIGMSFIDCIAPMYDKNGRKKKESISNLNRYLVLKHALEWIEPKSENVKKKRVFADEQLENPDVLREEIARIEAELPEVKQAAENIYQYLRNLKKYWGVDMGLMTEELSTKLDEMYPNYVPFFRQNDKRNITGARVTLANQRAPILEASGGSGMIVNPLESIIKLTEKYVKTASRNMSMQALANMADSVEGSGFIIERASERKQQEFNGETSLDFNEKDIAAETPEELKKITTEEDTWTKEFKHGQGYASVLIDGEKVWYQINDEMLFKSVADMTLKQMSDWLKGVNVLMNVKRSLITSNNPLFAVTNMIRDAQTAYHNSDINNPIEYLGAYFTALKHVIQRDPNYERWCAMGGGHSSQLSANMDSVNRALGKAMRTSKANKVMHSILHPIEAAVGFAAGVNDAIESVPRLMAFEDEMKRTGDVHRAINKADDITTNFKRGGQTAKAFNKVFMFSNAAIQGLDRTRRSFTQSDVEHGIRNRVIKYSVEAILVAAIQAFWNRRDDETEEDYKNLSKYMKRSQYVINISGGRFLRFPTAREQDLFRVVLTDVIDRVFGDKEAFDGLIGFTIDTLLPQYVKLDTDARGKSIDEVVEYMVTNTFRDVPIVGTITDFIANQNFTGSPIVPESYKNEVKEKQYNEKTSKLAVFLGRILGTSPFKVDHLINNELGIIGSINKSLFPMDASQRDISIGFGSRFIADSYYSTDVLNKVYEKRNASEENFKRNQNGESAAEFAKVDAAATFITQYNKAIKGLPESEKRAARKELLTIMNNWGNGDGASNEELIRLYNTTGEKLFLSMPEIKVYTENGKRNMTASEYVECVEKYTAGFEVAVQEVISSKEYKEADDKKKAGMIEKASKYALDAAKADTIPDASISKWEQRVIDGRDDLSETVSESVNTDRAEDIRADWKKGNFEYDDSKYTDEELSKIEQVEKDAAGYYTAKDTGADINNSNYRHIKVYESQLKEEMPIEEYAEVRAKAKTEGAKLDPNGSDTNLGQLELYDYLETTDYPWEVKAALFEAIGSKNWTNLYTGKKIQ